MKKVLLSSLILVFLGSQSVFAQTSSFSHTRRNMATIIFAGLGGAVLGLSTLSFYGKPQEHVGNIWLGLAVGVAAGTGYVLYQNSLQDPESFTELPNKWNQPIAAAPLWIYQVDF